MKIQKTAGLKVLGIGLLACGLSGSMRSAAQAENQPPTHCHVHQEVLRQDTVRIRYGLPVYKEGYWEARQKLFPYANTYVVGGCIVADDSPKGQKVNYCPKCRIAEKDWQKARENDKK